MTSRNLSIFTTQRGVRRIALMLVVTSLLLPMATEGLVKVGEILGLYGAAYDEPVHVTLATIVYFSSSLLAAWIIRKALSHVQASEARLQLQLDRMPIACFLLDADFRITSWNPAAERIFGYTAEESVGQSADILLVGGHWSAEFAEICSRLRAGDVSAHNTNQNRTKDGRIVTCRWSNTPFLKPDGTFDGCLTMAQDITEAEAAQAALRLSQRRYKELIDSLPHFVFAADHEDRFLTVNRMVCELLGKSDEEIVGHTPDELGVADPIDKEWRRERAMVRASGTVQAFESALPIAGEIRNVHVIMSPLRDEHGQNIGVTGISIDVTAQKKAEQVAQRLLNAVEQIDEVMFTTDRDGNITYVNHAFERVYGYTRELVVGKTPRILKSGEVPLANYQSLWAHLLAGRSTRAEYRNRCKDGTLIDVVSSTSPLFNDAGDVTGFIAVQQDVTEQRRAEEQRRYLDERLAGIEKIEALGTLAGGMAHDFNNILAIILTHATILDRLDDRARQKTAIATIKQAVQRGGTLSRQILTFARRADIRRENVNTATLLMEIGSMIAETFPRTINVRLNCDPDLPLISADPGQLHQALLNLCLNARDAMPNGGELAITTRLVRGALLTTPFPEASPDFVCITVGDTGVGMDDETRRRIFEPFFTTKAKGQGTGLGLAVVYGVVKSHGGLIDLDSQPGSGTTFRLQFPIVDTTNAPAPLPPVAEHRGTESLLVIDDEQALLESLSEQLRVKGYKIVPATNGIEALERFRALPSRPDAVVMDLGMPHMQAVDLIKAIRAEAPRMPIVAMTGYVDPDVHAAVREAGVAHIVQKPFGMEMLFDSIRRALS